MTRIQDQEITMMYIFWQNYSIKNIDIESLKTALRATSEKRGSTEVLKDYVHIIDVVRNSEVMIRQWKTYQKRF